MLLSELSLENPQVELHLCLCHMWKLGNPSTPDTFFALGTIWTDAEGDALYIFAAVLQKRIVVGCVYKISNYSLRTPREKYRTCTYLHWLALTAGTEFALQPASDPLFGPEVLEYVPFNKFPSRMGKCPYLTDFVGKVVGARPPNYIHRPTGISAVQNLTIVDKSGLEVDVSLWSDLASVLDADVVVLDDVVNPVVVAFTGFRIDTHFERTTTSSGLASRLFLDPTDEAAVDLRQHFTTNQRPITYVQPKFATPEKIRQHVEASFMNIHELLAMYATGGDHEPAYRCVATILDFDSEKHWCYRACPLSSRAVVANGHDFWCSEHDTVLTPDVAYTYRLKLLVSDPTTQATFVLLGLTADRIMPISAAELAKAYPDEYGELPPPLRLLLNQKVTFEVHLPQQLYVNTFPDIRISKIWGLVIQPAQLAADLPPPPPPRPPSPPARHDTPIHPDPNYVFPIPTYIPPTETSLPAAHTLAASIPLDLHHPPSTPSKGRSLPESSQYPVLHHMDVSPKGNALVTLRGCKPALEKATTSPQKKHASAPKAKPGSKAKPGPKAKSGPKAKPGPQSKPGPKEKPAPKEAGPIKKKPQSKHVAPRTNRPTAITRNRAKTLLPPTTVSETLPTKRLRSTTAPIQPDMDSVQTISFMNHVPTEVVEPSSSDDLPLSQLIYHNLLSSHCTFTTSIPTASQATPGQLASAALASSPLATVKQEHLATNAFRCPPTSSIWKLPTIPQQSEFPLESASAIRRALFTD